MGKNQMFSEMEKAAIGWLAGRDPVEIAANAAVEFDGTAFRFFSLGKQITVTYPDYRITPKLHHWHHLIILHYLNLADGSPLSGQWITFAQQRDGMVRGGGFDRRAEVWLARLQYEKVVQRCREMGGQELDSSADLSVKLPFLPRYPVMLNFWKADEDFPASGRLLLDGSAEHYLTIEDAVTVGDLILELLE